MFKTNEYFEGKVTSIALQTEKLPATVGVMAPGDYTFNTADKERMTVQRAIPFETYGDGPKGHSL